MFTEISISVLNIKMLTKISISVLNIKMLTKINILKVAGSTAL